MATFTLPLSVGGKGVATMPGHLISESFKGAVQKALADAPDLPDGKTIGAVALITPAGVNVAFVAKKELEKWGAAKVVAWVGKSGWNSGPLDVGAALQWSH